MGKAKPKQFEVGQWVYYPGWRNQRRYGQIVKLGREYLYIAECLGKHGLSQYTDKVALYGNHPSIRTPEQEELEPERQELLKEIDRVRFRYGRLNIEEVRSLAAILRSFPHL